MPAVPRNKTGPVASAERSRANSSSRPANAHSALIPHRNYFAAYL